MQIYIVAGSFMASIVLVSISMLSYVMVLSQRWDKRLKPLAGIFMGASMIFFIVFLIFAVRLLF